MDFVSYRSKSDRLSEELSKTFNELRLSPIQLSGLNVPKRVFAVMLGLHSVDKGGELLECFLERDGECQPLALIV